MMYIGFTVFDRNVEWKRISGCMIFASDAVSIALPEMFFATHTTMMVLLFMTDAVGLLIESITLFLCDRDLLSCRAKIDEWCTKIFVICHKFSSCDWLCWAIVGAFGYHEILIFLSSQNVACNWKEVWIVIYFIKVYWGLVWFVYQRKSCIKIKKSLWFAHKDIQ